MQLVWRSWKKFMTIRNRHLLATSSDHGVVFSYHTIFVSLSSLQVMVFNFSANDHLARPLEVTILGCFHLNCWISLILGLVLHSSLLGDFWWIFLLLINICTIGKFCHHPLTVQYTRYYPSFMDIYNLFGCEIMLNLLSRYCCLLTYCLF